MSRVDSRKGLRYWALPMLYLALVALLVGQALYYQAAAWNERELLEGLVGARLGSEGSAADKVVRSTALAFTVKARPHGKVNYGLQNPFARFLRPSAYTVYTKGGNCTGRSRLLVRLLKLQGIPAHKLYLYNPLGLKLLKDPPRAWVHVVVEARVGGRWVVADPLFNVVFRKSDGTLATVDDIAHDRALLASGRACAMERYDDWEDQLYTYQEVRRLPWFAIPVAGEWVRDLAVLVAGASRVDSWSAPSWMERPQFTLSRVSWAGACLLGVAFVPWLRARRTKRVPLGRVIPLPCDATPPGGRIAMPAHNREEPERRHA